MPFQILSSSGRSPEDVATDLRDSISKSLPGATAEGTAVGPGHFGTRVVSEAFAGKSRIRQQLVYGAIAHLMKGDAAPVRPVERPQAEIP